MTNSSVFYNNKKGANSYKQSRVNTKRRSFKKGEGIKQKTQNNLIDTDNSMVRGGGGRRG